MVLLVATGMLVDAFRKTLVLSPGFRIDGDDGIRYVSGPL
jgi:hypothetical protein